MLAKPAILSFYSHSRGDGGCLIDIGWDLYVNFLRFPTGYTQDAKNLHSETGTLILEERNTQNVPVLTLLSVRLTMAWTPQIRPGGHGRHDDTSVTPDDEENVPVGHGLHVTESESDR